MNYINLFRSALKKVMLQLRKYFIPGRKFLRQHSIDNFIPDFYCPTEKLAIELDGGYHNIPKQAASDRKRDLILNFYGIKVLRFKK